LDAGQCNDADSAVQIASALAKAFNVEVNELPLSLIISWYEQKAVCVLLALLHLGSKGIRLGPSLPAFLTPKTRETVERNHIVQVLEQTWWKVSGKNSAAEILGLNRSTLRAHMRKFDIRKP